LDVRRHRRAPALSWGSASVWRRCLRLSSTLLDVRCVSSRPCPLESFLSHRSPRSKDLGSFRYGQLPLQSSDSTSRPADPTIGCAFPEVLATFNGILARAPWWSGLFQTHPGSALRLSQPLSGFAASSSSTALFHAATVPDRLLQSVPLARVVRLSRGHWLPGGHPPALCADRSDDNPRVSPNSPARRRSSPDSLAAGGPFRRAEARLPVPPGRHHGTVTSR